MAEIEKLAYLRLPDDLQRLPAVAVLRGSPAHGVFLRIVEHTPLRPGQIIPVSGAELESLRKDVLSVAEFVA